MIVSPSLYRTSFLTALLKTVPEEDRTPFNLTSANQVRGEDIKMVIPNNINIWELMTETADQLYSFVAAE